MYSIFFCTTILLFEIFARLISETTGNDHFRVFCKCCNDVLAVDYHSRSSRVDNQTFNLFLLTNRFEVPVRLFTNRELKHARF